MNSPDEQALAAELRALRPTPRPEFASELDPRAAAGFPRRGGAAFGDRLRAAAGRASDHPRVSPRRLLAPAGALALASVLVVAVALVSSEGGSEDTGGGLFSTPAPEQTAPAGQDPNAYPRTPSAPPQQAASAGVAASAAGGESSAAAEAESVAGTEGRLGADKPNSGPYASQAGHRDVERSAEMVLGTEATDVRRAAGRVFTAVHAYDGIVLQSSIEEGGEGEAGASFELLVPSGKLGDALAAFSSIAEVRSRHESTADVTAKTVGLGERLQDSQATISGLLAQLADADTDGERAAAEAELHGERLRAAALRSNLAELQRRANLSQVSLKIESGEAGAAPADDDGSWGVGDALGEAGQILEVAAGVALIGLAILAPFALIALLA
jgi:hypothetical protein